MKASRENPKSNQLPSNITDEAINSAIKKSGYPLQTIIANKLRKSFYCQEEWSYIDNKTNENRNIDIMAQMDLYDFPKDYTKQPRIRPILNLLIECKQSELPYVFFLTPEVIRTFHYPNICGLRDKNLTIYTDDDPSTWSFPIIDAFDLSEDPYLIESVPNSMTFSKCVRQGKDLILSGNESYLSLTLPLLRSLQYFEKSENPIRSARYLDCHLTFGIGVIDSPMIGVAINEKSHLTKLIPWVRVFKYESFDTESSNDKSKLFAIDIVHKDYFDTFIKKKLLPFAGKFSTLILKHNDLILKGKAFAKGMEENSWTDIEPRLEKFSKAKIKKFKNVIDCTEI
jgi:hypothetical protein